MTQPNKAPRLDFPEPVSLLLREGKIEEAADWLVMEAQQSPTDPEIQYDLGRVLLAGERPRYEAAIRHLSTAVQADPSRSDYHLWLARAWGIKLEHGSMVAALTGAPIHLARHFSQAAKLDPENIPARADLLQFCLFAPGVLGGGEKRAAAHLEKLRVLAGGSVVYDQALAIFALHRGHFDEAANHLQAAGSKDESLAGHFAFQLGVIHMAGDRHGSALPHLERARELGSALERPAQTVRTDFIRNIAFQKARVELERNIEVSVTSLGLGRIRKNRQGAHPQQAALHELLSDIYENEGRPQQAALHRRRAGLARAA